MGRDLVLVIVCLALLAFGLASGAQAEPAGEPGPALTGGAHAGLLPVQLANKAAKRSSRHTDRVLDQAPGPPKGAKTPKQPKQQKTKAQKGKTKTQANPRLDQDFQNSLDELLGPLR